MSQTKTILLIDDEEDLLAMLKFQLGKKGFNVVTARDGVEGLEKLKTVKPALIILDMNMPRMGGIEFYNQILDAENKPKYPVYVLTARANLETLFKELDVSGFLSKPFEIDHLIKEIEKIITAKSADDADPRHSIVAKEVLIVESSIDRLKEISWLFLKEGFGVNTARSGEEALEHIARHPSDFVVMNWEVSDSAGDLLALKMQRVSKLREVKFIIFTGKSPDNMAIMDEIRKKTAMHRLVESDRPAELLEAVKEFIK